jgi:hypothetical protein
VDHLKTLPDPYKHLNLSCLVDVAAASTKLRAQVLKLLYLLASTGAVNVEAEDGPTREVMTVLGQVCATRAAILPHLDTCSLAAACVCLRAWCNEEVYVYQCISVIWDQQADAPSQDYCLLVGGRAHVRHVKRWQPVRRNTKQFAAVPLAFGHHPVHLHTDGICDLAFTALSVFHTHARPHFGRIHVHYTLT